MSEQPRHPRTGRWLAFDCETDCLDHCAGLCGNLALEVDDITPLVDELMSVPLLTEGDDDA